MKSFILENYHEESAMLFDRWLLERNLLGYVQRIVNAQQFGRLLPGGVTYQGMNPSMPHYYEVPIDSDNEEYRIGVWNRAYHGTYFYTLEHVNFGAHGKWG